ncbi:hypothetical protein J40TS1_37150 [Paenibacillus montaniterrae]|uniref:Uncharacterized protein n=1 Tax=Paenibacillus montaniterrae TaxID=429341 RepID=A0A919YQA5_9BACL|nr:hypothetical protein [Paenibacillus montaniterrae]GIP18073.1 hypothetical protein J40TS1_37150 [Paenibacillus montaniterrae]
MSKKRAAIYICIVIILLVTFRLEYKTVWNQELFDSWTEDHTEFLSDEYFSGLDELYTQVKLKHKKWHSIDGPNKIAAKTVLAKMMEDLESNPDAIINHQNFNRYFETFDQHVRRLSELTEEIHFFRNTLNKYSGAPSSLDEMITLTAQHKWQLFSAKFHRYNVEGINAALNVKFISADGRFEVVYNAGTGEMVDDPVNMGTYNYAPGSIKPRKYFKHYLFDVVPWKKWGNVEGVSYKDITRLQSRHGTDEEKHNTLKIEKLIEERTLELTQKTHL